MAEVCTLDWHVTPLRDDRFLDIWEPAAAKCTAFGATSWSLTRSVDDPLSFQQTMVWENRADFERYWFSEEIERAREQSLGWYVIPMLPAWHTLLAGSSLSVA